MRVVAVSSSAEHRFSKTPRDRVELVANHGVLGDCHAGDRVQHRSRDGSLPNLRQVSLLSVERLAELADAGFALAPGDLGENLLVEGVDLFELSTDSRLHLGAACLRVTGLRNPCAQIEAFRPGLLAAVGRRGGVMAVVESGGTIQPGCPIQLVAPERHTPLARV